MYAQHVRLRSSLAVRFLRLAALASLASFTMAAVGCSSEATVGDEEDEEGAGVDVGAIVPAAPGPLKFRDACKAGTKITIAAVGDVLLHSPLQQQAYASPEGTTALWKNVEPLLSRADLTYANLEGPCAEGLATTGEATDPGKRFDNKVYSSYPQFNYHPSLIGSLKESGIDVVSTANNHALDRRWAGADRTIENLKEAGLPFSGTAASTDTNAPWYAITAGQGREGRLGRMQLLDERHPRHEEAGPPLLRGQGHAALDDPRLASRRGEVDAVIVTPHWGVEYNHAPEQRRSPCSRMLDAGATAILGGHPHVVQPWEKYTTRDGREGFVIYSLGNFVSGQSGIRAVSLMLVRRPHEGPDGKFT